MGQNTSEEGRQGEGGWLKRLGPDLGVVALLAFLCILFFWRIITPNLADRGSFPAGDFVHQFYAFGLYEARQLLSGHLPLWNPYTFSGHPFLADVQSAIFYPFSLLTILLSAPWGFSLFALEIEAVFHFFLASLFTYLFARRLLRHRLAALLSALVFTYSGYLTSYPSQQLAVLEVDVWLPLILLFLDIGLEKMGGRGSPDSLPPIILAGLTLGISLLAGHPQSSMYVVYASALYLAFRSWCYGLRWARAIGVLALFIAIGFGLAAVQLVPSLEFTRLSTRAQASYLEMSGGFPRYDLLQLLLPGSVSVMSPLYIGVLPLLLALWALVSERGRRVIFWAGLAGGALLLSLGGNTFFYNLFYLFAPGFGLFRSQERAAFIFSFALALLAGYGALRLTRSMPKAVKNRYRLFQRFISYLFIGALGLIFLFFYGWLEAEWAKESPFGSLLGRSVLLTAFLLGSLGLFHLRGRRLVRGPLLSSLMMALIVFDLFSTNWQNNLEEVGPKEHWPLTPLVGLPQGDEGPFRLHNEWRLPGNYGCVYGLEDIWGASPLRLERYDKLFSALPMERIWHLTNVKYVITWRKVLAPHSQVLYEEPQGEGTSYLHRLEESWPRAYVVHRAEVVDDDQRALALLADPDFDPRQVALLEERPELELAGGGTADSTVNIVERQPNRLVLEVETPADGLLVLSEVYYPGWRAYVDGQETRVYRADYTLRAVFLRAGRHRVEMIYDPLSVKLGLAIFLLTLIAVFAIIV